MSDGVLAAIATRVMDVQLLIAQYLAPLGLLLALCGSLLHYFTKGHAMWAIPRDDDLLESIASACAVLHLETSLVDNYEERRHRNLENSYVGNMETYLWAALVYADVLTDINGFVQYVRFGHFQFAAFSIVAARQVCREQACSGNPRVLYRQTKISSKRGMHTDRYLRILRTEQTVEAFPHLLLTCY